MDHLNQFIQNHWPLCLTFLVLLILVFLNELMMQKKKAKEITPQTAVDLINNDQAVLIDLRDKELFKKGHIIDSINASADDFEQPKMTKFKDKTIILVCDRGQKASMVAAKIRTQGYQPMVLEGGITAWQNASLPLVKKG